MTLPTHTVPAHCHTFTSSYSLTFKIELDFERKFDVGDLRAFITQRVAHGSQTDTY